FRSVRDLHAAELALLDGVVRHRRSDPHDQRQKDRRDHPAEVAAYDLQGGRWLRHYGITALSITVGLRGFAPVTRVVPVAQAGDLITRAVEQPGPWPGVRFFGLAAVGVKRAQDGAKPVCVQPPDHAAPVGD